MPLCVRNFYNPGCQLYQLCQISLIKPIWEKLHSWKDIAADELGSLQSNFVVYSLYSLLVVIEGPSHRLINSITIFTIAKLVSAV